MGAVLTAAVLILMFVTSVALVAGVCVYAKSTWKSVRAYPRAASSDERRASTIRLVIGSLIGFGVLTVLIVAPFGRRTLAYVVIGLGVSAFLTINIVVAVMIKKNGRRK